MLPDAERGLRGKREAAIERQRARSYFFPPRHVRGCSSARRHWCAAYRGANANSAIANRLPHRHGRSTQYCRGARRLPQLDLLFVPTKISVFFCVCSFVFIILLLKYFVTVLSSVNFLFSLRSYPLRLYEQSMSGLIWSVIRNIDGYGPSTQLCLCQRDVCKRARMCLKSCGLS